VSYAPARARLLRAERPWREHLALYCDLFCNDEVAATLWPGPLGGPRSRSQVEEILGADIRHWEERRFGPWVFFERETGVFVGRGGLRHTTIAGVTGVEVLYALRPDAWGRGYATEIAALAIAEGRRVGLAEVFGIAAYTNVASRRVLEKSGLRFQATVEHAGIPHWLGRTRLVP
jgi:RimJ/RimL family protein N-acetyltransferase